MPLLETHHGRRRTGRDAPAVDEVRIDGRRDAGLIRDERLSRCRYRRRGDGSRRPPCRRCEGNRECGPRERDPPGALHWASLVEERALTPPLFLRAPGEQRIASRWGRNPPGVDRTPASDYFVRYAPRDPRPRRSRSRSPCATCTPPPPARAQRLRPRCCAGGVSAAVSAIRAAARPTSPAAPEPGFDPLDVVLGMQPGSAAAEASLERLSVAIPSHAITLQGSALFHTGDRQRVHAAVEGKLDDTLRRHGAAHDLRAARREQRATGTGCATSPSSRWRA